MAYLGLADTAQLGLAGPPARGLPRPAPGRLGILLFWHVAKRLPNRRTGGHLFELIDRALDPLIARIRERRINNSNDDSKRLLCYVAYRDAI